MCGIFFYKGLGGTIDRDAYDKALSRMDYRGPDNRDIFFGKNYVIGHTRLAIIDVSLDANQPFWNSDKRYVISFNGEIYNYKELQRKLMEAGYSMRTNSDTEVLLEFIVHYGLDTTLECVRGMFAFVFYDTLTERTIAVRDHFGQKPLYYFEENGKFAVASSIRSILALKENLEPNVESYITYLCTRGIIHPEDTFFSGIKCLPAGRILIYDKGSLVKQEYFNAWDLYNNELACNNTSVDDAINELDMLLEQSVRRHLVSDVPVGILLSGGIDSTLLYWYAHDINDNLTVFTKTSPGIENIPMDIVPQILKTKMSKCLFNLEQEKLYLTVLVDFIKSFHSPSKWGGGPPMYRLCAEARKLGVHVLLGGDCADEYFAGYNEHEDVFSKFDGDLFKLDKCVDIQRESPFYSEKYCGEYESYQVKTRRRILDHLSEIPDPFEKFFHASLLHDTSVFLQSCNLQHSDAYSMMASVELRNPMLDFDLVRFVSNLPSYLRYSAHNNANKNKYLLRELASRKIGDFVNVPKEGTRNYSMKISDHSFWDFDRFMLNEIMELPFKSGKVKSNKKLIFRLLNLEIFHRLYFLGEEYPINDIMTETGKKECLF
jgi:asparagine synthase (glutamine-hydrolysing)